MPESVKTMTKLLKFPTQAAIDSSPPSLDNRRTAIRGEPGGTGARTSLTETRVEKLPVTGAAYYVNDAGQPGLSVRVSAGGVKAYVFTKHKYGKLTRITLGRANAVRLDAARKAAQALHGELAMGVDVGAARRKTKLPKSITMDEAFERFLGLKTRRSATLTDYRMLWRLHTPAGLKRKAVNDVAAGDVENAKLALGSRRRTANKLVTLLGAIMAKSGRWADNPARDVNRHQEHVRTRRLSIDELTRIWSVSEPTIDSSAGGLWRDFFRLMILTGARRSPFCSMRWKDLDLDAGVWMVPVEWAKSKREMAIPLSDEAVRILKARLALQEAVSAGQAENRGWASVEWVWPSADSKTGHVVNPEKPWRRLLKAAGVKEHTTLHDIRRTLGSRLAMDGVAGATISKVLGHVSPQSLKAYVHLDVAAGREAVDRTMARITGPHG